MYGSHSPPNNPGNYNPGPPQPEWRPSPTSQQHQPSWRLPSPSAAPLLPPPPVSAPSYNPNIYGPVPGAPPLSHSNATSPVPAFAGADTTTWGVRYNHQQHIQTPPPLPPRPSSSVEQSHVHLQSPVVSSPGPSLPISAGLHDGSQQTMMEYPPQWTTIPSSYTQQQAASPLPPPPPPIPPGYQNEILQQSNQTWQQTPHPVYSNLPPSHRYDPPVQNQNQPSPPPVPEKLNTTMYYTSPVAPPQSVDLEQGNPPSFIGSPLQTPPSVEQNSGPISNTAAGGFPQVVTPLSPAKNRPNMATTGSSALGLGGPSDWEHFGPTPGDIDDVETFQPRMETPVQSNPAFKLPSGHSSPIQGAQGPSPPARIDRVESPPSEIPAEEPPESIDGVIEAWTRPISPPARPSNEHSREGSVSKLEQPSPINQGTPLEVSKPRVESPAPAKNAQPTAKSSPIVDVDPKSGSFSTKEGGITVQPKFMDPYEDLDPWFKSSLVRYVAMLRKEAVADSDEERFKIFSAFVAKETKLREILYNIEHETPSEKHHTGDPPVRQQGTSKTADSPPQFDSGLIPVETEDLSASPQTPQSATAEEFEDGRYSPGGRPILPSKARPQSNSQGLHRSTSHPIGHSQAHKLANMRAHEPGAGFGIDSGFSRATSVPPSMMNTLQQQQTLEPLTTNPPQPIYTPFRYTEGPQRGSDKLTFDRPAYQAYSELRQASAESGRLMSNAPPSTPGMRSPTISPAPARNEHDETFIGLIREKSVAYRTQAPRKTSSPPPIPESFRKGRPSGPIEELRSLVSKPIAKQSESFWNIATRKDLEKYSDDLTYVQEKVDSWERVAKERHNRVEKERIRRQEECESHIDALFNDKEIGYADINILEEEFRQTEARVQLDEERRELDDFVTNVFDPLDARLKEEISKLTAHYETVLSQLDHENSRTKESVGDKYQVSHTMKTVNDVYRKLEARYQKRLEIAVDRERRRKKAERRPLVFMGNSPALKKLDGDFDRMEKQNILEAAKDRDERANRLMDSFDDAILRGLGENQSLLDDISVKLKKLNPAVLKSSGLPDAEIEQILKSVTDLVASLRADSESILRSFGIADSALNDADYSVSVAEARYSNADEDIFRRLEDEKKKEDAKIQTDLDSKLESVRKGPAEMTTQINDLLGSLGKTLGLDHLAPSETAPASHPVDIVLPGPRPPTVGLGSRTADQDPDHQERLKKALEDAKKRNAARTNA